MPTMTVSGHRYNLDVPGVEAALQGVLPEPIHEHFVVINGRRWPPKQVLALVTGLDRADFTTHQARSVLTRLGFTAGRGSSRVRHHSMAPPAAASERPSAAAGQPESMTEALRPFIGQWVAVRGEEILVAAATPRQVVAWLTQHRQRAHSMFKVVDSEQAISGASPQ